MRRFRRKRSGGHRGGKARKIRWLGETWSVNSTLESSEAAPNGSEWLSFWLKWPASLTDVDHSLPTNQVPFNEPVDETLVRFYTTMGGILSAPGSSGAASPFCFTFAAIVFSGGEFPNFFDSAVFDASSLVAPPSPFRQIDDPWIFRYTQGSAAEVGALEEPGYELAHWTRTMRKLPAGDGILAVVQVQSLLTPASAPIGVSVAGETRMAVKSGYSR